MSMCNFLLLSFVTKNKHGKYSIHRKVKISCFDKESTMHVVKLFLMPLSDCIVVLLVSKSLGNNEFVFLGTFTLYAILSGFVAEGIDLLGSLNTSHVYIRNRNCII